jgi:hypothetical protein
VYRIWWGNLREMPRHRWEDNVKVDLQELGGEEWTGFIWLGIWIGGGHL